MEGLRPVFFRFRWPNENAEAELRRAKKVRVANDRESPSSRSNGLAHTFVLPFCIPHAMSVDQFECKERVVTVRVSMSSSPSYQVHVITHHQHHKSLSQDASHIFIWLSSGTMFHPPSHDDIYFKIANQSGAGSIKPWLKAHLNTTTDDDGPSIHVSCSKWQR